MNPQQGRQQQGRQPNRAKWGGQVIWVALLVSLLVWTFWGSGNFGSKGVAISYTAFEDQLGSGNVSSVTLTGQKIQGQLKKAADKKKSDGSTQKYTEFVTYVPAVGDDTLLPTLKSQNVEIEVNPQTQSSWAPLLIYLLPIVLIVGFGYLVFKRLQSQGKGIMRMGQSRARLYDRTQQEKTTFEDVAGSGAAKRELEEIVEFLRDPQSFRKLGGEMPRGVLLVGPPGTGKTLLARAVAGEAEVPFFSISGSDFMEMLVGVGASRVRNLFQATKQSAPAIIFIDELDSIGRTRGAGLGGGHDEREQTLNQLLSEMDGFEPHQGVVVVAATNRPDILDKALLRPGRFDRRVTVNLPTKNDRAEILKIHSRNRPLADDVDLERLARATPGFSGADLANLLNEAALLAARKRKDRVEQDDVDQARDKITMGPRRESLALTESECRLLAYHESGHAVVAAVLPNADPVEKVSIIPRGQAMGITQQLPEKDQYIYAREYLEDRLAVMLGGRAAEKLILGTATTGAEQDLKQATHLARKMILDFAMSEDFEFIALGSRDGEVFLGEQLGKTREYSENTAQEVDRQVEGVLRKASEKALETLETHRQGLDRLADALLEHEEIDGPEVLRILELPREEESAVAPSAAPAT